MVSVALAMRGNPYLGNYLDLLPQAAWLLVILEAHLREGASPAQPWRQSKTPSPETPAPARAQRMSVESGKIPKILASHGFWH